MAGVFDLELHDTPEGDEDISDEEFFEPELEVWCLDRCFPYFIIVRNIR